MRSPLYPLFKTCGWMLALASLSGCAYVTEGSKLGAITPPANAMRPMIEHTVGDFRFTIDGGKLVTDNLAGVLINQNVLDAWQDRRYIRDHEAVEPGQFSGKADYNLTLSGSQHGESSVAMQILSGLTLFLVPYTVTQHYDIHFTLADVKTGKHYAGKIEESNKAYIELLLWLALPLAADNEQAMFARMGDHLYEQLYRQGAFQSNGGAERTAN